MDPSPALDARIRELTSRFDKFSEHIMRCHVIVRPLSHREHQDALYDLRIDITLPDEEIGIRRAHPADHAHESPYVALRDAFGAARRRLEEYERRRRPTDEGRLIYFHRNSVLWGLFEDQATGAKVRFAEESGDIGPQASTVHVIP